MIIPHLQLIVLFLFVILFAACAPASTPLAPTIGRPTVVSGIPTSPSAPSPSPQPTYVATAVPVDQSATGETQIRIVIGNTVLSGRLWDNATARDLIAQLPLTLTFSDFNALEKIATLPQKLSLAGVPAGDDPLPNEIGYYAPWGNLVFYYGDVGYFNGIVRLGQFDGSLDALINQTGDFTAKIELAK